MADRSGYIGRAPGDSSIIVARQTHSPTGVQTDFTFASGYTVGYIDAYLNGSRLINAEDYTATDGTTVGLTSAANNGDILELVAYKAFNLANVAASTGNFSVGNNLTVTDDLTVSGDTTSIVNITGTAGTFTNLTVTDQFTGNATGTAATFTKITATDQFSGNISGIAATFTGPVTIGGTLTYEDATNVDSVGLVTARTGVRVTAGGMVVTAGVSTFAAALDVNAELDVDGQTDLDNLIVAGVSTFSAALDINAELDVDGQTDLDNLIVAGVSTFSSSIDLNGELDVDGQTDLDNLIVAGVSTFSDRVLVGTTTAGYSSADNLTIEDSGDCGLTLRSGIHNAGSIFFADGTSGSAEYEGFIDYQHVEGDLRFGTGGGQERMRLISSGNFGIGTTVPSAQIEIEGNVSSTTQFSGFQGLRIQNANGAAHGVTADINFVAGTISTNRGAVIGAEFVSGTNGNALYFATNGSSVSSNDTPTERLRISSAGNVLVGCTTIRGNYYNTSTVIPKFQLEGTTYSDSALSITTNGANSSRQPYSILLLSRSRGLDLNSNTLLANNDVIGAVDFQGSDGTQFVSAAAIEGVVNGTPGADDMPGALTFRTTPDGASTPTEKLRLTKDGKLILSGTQRTTPFIAGDGGMCIEQNYDGNLIALSIRNKSTHEDAATSMSFSLNRSSGGDQDFTAGEIKIVKEAEWTSISSTVDSAMVFSTMLNGTMAQKMSISSAGRADFVGRVSSSEWFQSNRTTGTDSAFYATLSGVEKLNIRANGSASFAAGAFAIESDGDISTNIRGHGHIELDSAGTFTSPKIKLFSNTGNATFAGNVVLSTSGAGIDFSATADSAASPSSELLDDYEEGSWTPTLLFGSGGGAAAVGMVYGMREGHYVKIGKQVIAQFRIELSDKGSSTGGMTISTPFAADNSFTSTGIDGNVMVCYNSGMSSSQVGSAHVSGYVEGGTSLAYFTARLSTGDAATLNNGDIDNDFSISGTMMFHKA